MRSERALPNGWPPEFARTPSDRQATLVLAGLRGVVPRSLLVVAERAGTARATLQAVRRGEAGSAADGEYARSADPVRVQASLEQSGARFAPWGDPEYPPMLADLADPPLGVFLRGRRLDPGRIAAAIVGARGCTAYGAEMARSLGRGLAAAGVTVVSGAARGIDAAAHQGALDAPGWTVAVLGSGIDVAYPRGNARLIARVAESGTLVSEYGPGTPAEPFRFPARNRIVAALARVVVVVEGAPGSGSTITVDHANDCGRDVCAVPGPVTGPLSAVPNELIRSGAPLVRSAEDVLQELGLPVGATSAAPPELPPGEAAVLAALGGVAEEAEALAERSGVPAAEVLTVLLELEMRGLVRRAGGRFERTLRAGR